MRAEDGYRTDQGRKRAGHNSGQWWWSALLSTLGIGVIVVMLDGQRWWPSSSSALGEARLSKLIPYPAKDTFTRFVAPHRRCRSVFSIKSGNDDLG